MDSPYNVIGIDASLTSTGISFFNNYCETRTERILPRKLRGVERLHFNLTRIEEIVKSMIVMHYGTPLIILEGYSMGTPRKTNSVGRFFDIGELGGVIKLYAYREGIRVLLVPPSNLKKFVTGKGNVDKPEVIKHVGLNWGFITTRDDEADSYGLMKMGQSFLNDRPTRNVKKREALEKCQLILPP